MDTIGIPKRKGRKGMTILFFSFIKKTKIRGLQIIKLVVYSK